MAFQQTKLEVIDRVNARKTHNGHWMTVVLPMTMLAYLFFTTYALLYLYSTRRFKRDAV